MKILSGSDIADYVKQRQLRQFRALAHSRSGRKARLAIIQTIDDPVIDTYVGLKQAYAVDVEAEIELFHVDQSEAEQAITDSNHNPEIDGIILQLPLADESKREELISLIDPAKDVDGLAEGSSFRSATATAILWLLAGYNIEPAAHKVLLVGNGRLVGAPLAKLLRESGVEPTIADHNTVDLAAMVGANSLVITATGQPGLISAEMLNSKHIVVDAGVASEHGVNHGDVDRMVYDQAEIQAISARIGGVGPLTVSALFDNLLQAASKPQGN